MASYTFDIDKYQFERAVTAIRSRSDVIKLWMQLAKLIINYYPPEQNFVYASIDIVSERMSRAFIRADGQLFSIAFPFRIDGEKGQHSLRSVAGVEVDSQVTSEILLAVSALNSGSMQSEWDLFQYFEEQGGASGNFWPLFTEILDAEDGYLRFDHDPVRRNGHIHPLDHADIFYANGSTFKVGFRTRPSIETMLDILNRETDCHYLELP